MAMFKEGDRVRVRSDALGAPYRGESGVVKAVRETSSATGVAYEVLIDRVARTNNPHVTEYGSEELRPLMRKGRR